MSKRVDELLAALTEQEKSDLVMGQSMWTTRPVERLGIPSMIVTDGPAGVRGGGQLGTGTPTACIPAGSVLGATWDPDLVRLLGGLLGDECQAKGAHVLLAPTINLHRSPLGGRNFECYSEDPILSGHMAAAFVRGVQERGVGTTAKHFVANDSEFERTSIDSQVDERTLREVYLVPFEHAVKGAKTWGVMSSYNRVNGTFASENEWLLETVLREQWGFDGFVVSDWFAVQSTAASVRAGLSLEMPGPGRFYGADRISAAVDASEVTRSDLDRIVRDVLNALERTGALDGTGGGAESTLDRPEDRALIRKAAAAGTVLIRNDSTLPLDVSGLSSLAVIGPNARHARVMGGGSATVNAYRSVSPLEAFRERLGQSIDIRYARGCDIDRSTPILADPLLKDGLHLEFFANHDLEGPVVGSSTVDTGRIAFFGAPAPGVSYSTFSMRASGSLVPDTSGPHFLRLVQSGRARVLVDGQVVIDATQGEFERGDEFFGLGSVEIEARLDLHAGVAVELSIEFSSRDSTQLAGVRVGVVPEQHHDLLAEAERLASECDAAVLVVGTNDDWETEGRDRELFELPGDQVELIERVCAVNPKTVVVVNAGGPHDMSWLDLPAAVLSVGFGGQELGHALLDVLLGDVDPGGRMPTTIAARYEHSPAYLNYPGENSVVRYGEGLFVGYRWFDERLIEPAVHFGHGLSYATFDWGGPRGPATSDTAVTGPIVIEVDVTNTSDRSGSEVVQIYVEPPPSRLHRPRRELKGFAKLHVQAGEMATASVTLDQRAFAYFDPGDQSRDRHIGPGWVVEPGKYCLVTARSAGVHEGSLEVTLTGEVARFDA